MTITDKDKKQILNRLINGHEVCNIMDSDDKKILRAISKDIKELKELKYKKYIAELGELLKQFD